MASRIRRRDVIAMLVALKDARLTLLDLGACDDPQCGEDNCAHTLRQVIYAISIGEEALRD